MNGIQKNEAIEKMGDFYSLQSHLTTVFQINANSKMVNVCEYEEVVHTYFLYRQTYCITA